MPNPTMDKIGKPPTEAQIRAWRAAFYAVSVEAVAEALSWPEPQAVQPQRTQKQQKASA